MKIMGDMKTESSDVVFEMVRSVLTEFNDGVVGSDSQLRLLWGDILYCILKFDDMRNCEELRMEELWEWEAWMIWRKDRIWTDWLKGRWRVIWEGMKEEEEEEEEEDEDEDEEEEGSHK